MGYEEKEKVIKESQIYLISILKELKTKGGD